MSTRSRVAAFGVVALALAVIAWAPLTPASGGDRHPHAWCLRCGDVSGLDFALNVLLFVPLGIGLRLSSLSLWRVLAISAAVTVTVELSQWHFAMGRVASFADLVANVLGAAVGMVLAEHGRELVLAPPAKARTLALGALVFWLIIQLGTAWEFMPSPTRSDYWGQVAANLGHLDRFTGQVTAATIGDTPIRNGRMRDNDPVRQLFDGDARVTASVIPGTPTQAVAPIVSIFDGEQREIMLLGQEGEDLVFRIRTRATGARFRTPTISLFGVFPRDATDGVRRRRDTLVVSGWRKGWQLTVSALSGDTIRTRSAILRPSYGWALMLPFEHTWTALSGRFTAAWMAMLLFPAGYWGVRGMQSTTSISQSAEAHSATLRVMTLLGFAALLLSTGLVALPLVLGLEPAGAWEWGGALAGIASGSLAGILSSFASPSRSQRLPA